METLTVQYHDKELMNESFSWLLDMVDYHLQQREYLKRLVQPKVMSAGVKKEIINHNILAYKYYTALTNKYLIRFTVKDMRTPGSCIREFISNHRKLHHKYRK